MLPLAFMLCSAEIVAGTLLYKISSHWQGDDGGEKSYGGTRRDTLSGCEVSEERKGGEEWRKSTLYVTDETQTAATETGPEGEVGRNQPTCSYENIIFFDYISVRAAKKPQHRKNAKWMHVSEVTRCRNIHKLVSPFPKGNCILNWTSHFEHSVFSFGKKK